MHFTGWLDDVTEATHSMDVGTLLSADEGLGLVLVEAMACAKPTIGSAIGGIKDIIIENETGYTIPLNDDEALANKIIKLAKNKQLCTDLGLAGKARAFEVFTPEVYVNKLQGVYDKILKH